MNEKRGPLTILAARWPVADRSTRLVQTADDAQIPETTTGSMAHTIILADLFLFNIFVIHKNKSLKSVCTAL